MALCERSDRYEVAGCADGDSLADAIRRTAPQLVVLETGLPRVQALDLVARMRAEGAGSRFVLLAGRVARKDMIEALRAGANAVVLESGTAAELFHALDQALAGLVYLPGPLDTEAAPDPVGSLSAREYQVFTQLVEGVRPKEIAARLGLSVKTVDTHRKKLMEKLGVRDVASLVRLAMERGMG